MKRFLALIAAAIALLGCATNPPVTASVSLSVRSIDLASGSYVLELRNDTVRPVLYLNPYLIFHSVRTSEPEPFPVPLEDVALLVHDTKLQPGASATLSGKCTPQGSCARKPTYVAVLACWFTEAFTCEEYLPVWTETSLNGA